MRTWMRRARPVCLAAVLLLMSVSPASALSSEAPQLHAPAVAQPGSTITVRGSAWQQGSWFGCLGDDSYEDITIRITPESGGDDSAYSVPLATVDADEDGRFNVSVEIPDLPEGQYLLLGTAPGVYPEADTPIRVTN